MPNKDKPKHLRLVGSDKDRLTAKQEGFAQDVSKGAMLSDAYRTHYSADGMKDSSVWTEACKLAQHPKVSQRIKQLQDEYEQDRRTIERRREEWVLKRLQEEADKADNASSRIRALELVGKTVGMFTDRIETTDTEERSAADIERELKRRLASIIGTG